jgi:multiple sugar transport system permease protein
MSVSEIFHKPPYLFPPNLNLSYYKEAFFILLPYLKNSLIISICTLIVTLCISLPSAFALAKFNFLLKKLIYLLFTFVQILPTTAIIIPLFLIFNSLRLINNYLSAIFGISVLTIPFSVIILTAYISSIPTDILESAMIDGAGLFKIFWSIIIPLSRASIATVTILTFILAWGDFIVSLSFLKNREIQPMSIGLYNFITQYGIQWNMLMAGSTIFALPVIILAIIVGGKITSGLVTGALK